MTTTLSSVKNAKLDLTKAPGMAGHPNFTKNHDLTLHLKSLI